MSSKISTSDEEIFNTHAKTFSFAAKFLGQRVAEDIFILYRFCRLIDDIADEGGNASIARQNLQAIKAQIEDGHSDDPFLSKFLKLIEGKDLPKQYIFDLIDGVLSDCHRHIHLQSEEALITYCYRVAGTVGGLMCPILGVEEDHLSHAIKPAISLGIGMQLTNIARDIKEDALNNRCYIPKDWLDIEDIQILTDKPQEHTQDARAAVRRLLALADMYYAAAWQGYAYLPFRSRVAIMVAAHLYRQIGVKIKKRGYQYWRGRVYVPQKEKILHVLLMGFYILKPDFWKKSHHQPFALSLGASFDT